MTRWSFSLVAALLAAGARAEEPFSTTLVSSSGKRDTLVDGAKLTPGVKPAWKVEVVTLHGGRQEGTELIRVDNGAIQVTLIPTRGMGILDVRYRRDGKPTRIGWDSPVKDVVNPAFVNLTARGGTGWLEGFNEFVCRCGLENIGQPGRDSGGKAEADLTLHGRIANTPAGEVTLSVELKPPHRISIRATVREVAVFGPNLELQSEFSTEPGTMAFRIADKVVNRGGAEQEFQMLYHTNFGKPLLGEGARVVAPVGKVTPFDAGAAGEAKQFGSIAGPKAGYASRVYFLEPLVDKNDRTLALVHDSGQTQGVSMRWSVNELPCLTLWKNTGADEDGYVVGVEPGTSYPNARRVERDAKRVPTLKPKEARKMTLDFEIHTDEQGVKRVLKEIEALQRTKEPVIAEPFQPKKD